MTTKTNQAAELRRRAEAMVNNGTQVVDEFISALEHARQGVSNSSERYVVEHKLGKFIASVCRRSVGLDILCQLDEGVAPARILAYMLQNSLGVHNFPASSSETSNMITRNMHEIVCSVVSEYVQRSSQRVVDALGEGDE